jgi:hypothetical protein
MSVFQNVYSHPYFFPGRQEAYYGFPHPGHCLKGMYLKNAGHLSQRLLTVKNLVQ